MADNRASIHGHQPPNSANTPSHLLPSTSLGYSAGGTNGGGYHLPATPAASAALTHSSPAAPTMSSESIAMMAAVANAIVRKALSDHQCKQPGGNKRHHHHHDAGHHHGRMGGGRRNGMASPRTYPCTTYHQLNHVHHQHDTGPPKGGSTTHTHTMRRMQRTSRVTWFAIPLRGG